MIRQLRKEELKKASDLADSIYPKELYESLKCFEKKFSFFRSGFLGCFISNKLVGYMVCHPWKGNVEVPLNYHGKYPSKPDCFYIHDFAVKQKYRRKGYGKKLFEAALKKGKKNGFNKFMLIAVNENIIKMCEESGFEVVGKIKYGKGVISHKMVMKCD